jgi:ABC-type transport system involved in multi-copper enzyme maturation permease subunit
MNGRSWRLWRSQIGAILRLEIRKNFLARRGLWVYMLAAAPAVLFGLHAFAKITRGHSCDLGRDSLLFAGIFQFFYLRLAVFFGCVGVFMNLFRGEMLEKSLHYYLLAPMRREVLLAGKYLAGVLTTAAIFCTGTVLALAAILIHFPRSVIDQYLFSAGGFGQVLAYIGTTALACVGYGGVFLVMGFLFRNPIVPAALVLVWESINPFLPSILKKISVIFYLQSLCPVAVPAQGDWSFLAVLAQPTPAYIAIPGLLLVTFAGLWLAARKVRRLEINYGSE